MDEMMRWLGDHAWQAWLGTAIVLAGLEMLSLDLILIMLAAGAVVGMITAIAGLPVAVQILAAMATSVAALALVRPTMAKRMHGGPELSLGHGKLVGSQGTVTEEITALTPGRIKLAGEIWSALPYDERSTIQPGDTVEVLEIRGATAYVLLVPELES